MSREFSFFIYLLERYAEHLGVTADVAYSRLAEKGLVGLCIVLAVWFILTLMGFSCWTKYWSV